MFDGVPISATNFQMLHESNPVLPANAHKPCETGYSGQHDPVRAYKIAMLTR